MKSENRDNSGWTPLHEAVNGGFVRVAEMLVEYGSEVDAGDNDGRTSLHLACEKGHLDLVRLLVHRGANIEAKSHEGRTAFRVACLHAHRDVAKYLADRGACVDTCDADGHTTLVSCLLLASTAETKATSVDIVRFLLERGADPNARDSEASQTCLHVAAHFGLADHLALLINSTMADKDSTNKRGQSPLQLACARRNVDCVRILLRSPGINLDQRDVDGNTALSVACQLGDFALVNELLQAGAQIYASARNPIKLAHQSGNLELVALLQSWSTLCYQQSYQQHQQQQNPPRSSKSTESFRSNSARISETTGSGKTRNEREIHMPNFNNRCAITPTTFSNYMKHLGHMTSSVSASPIVASSVNSAVTPSKFDMFSARNFLPHSQNRFVYII